MNIMSLTSTFFPKTEFNSGPLQLGGCFGFFRLPPLRSRAVARRHRPGLVRCRLPPTTRPPDERSLRHRLRPRRLAAAAAAPVLENRVYTAALPSLDGIRILPCLHLQDPELRRSEASFGQRPIRRNRRLGERSHAAGVPILRRRRLPRPSRGARAGGGGAQGVRARPTHGPSGLPPRPPQGSRGGQLHLRHDRQLAWIAGGRRPDRVRRSDLRDRIDTRRDRLQRSGPLDGVRLRGPAPEFLEDIPAIDETGGAEERVRGRDWGRVRRHVFDVYEVGMLAHAVLRLGAGGSQMR